MKNFIFKVSISISILLLLFSCQKEKEIYNGVDIYHKGGATVSIYEMDGKDYHLVSGNIVDDFLMSSDKEWVIDEDINVEMGGHLIIEPGTKIYGSIIGLSYIVVKQGGKISANGTEESPILITSFNVLKETQNPGDWGGLIINGLAPVGNDLEYIDIKEKTGDFGGDISDDNSGVIKNVIIEYSGKTENVDFDVYGLSLYGVGSETIIQNVTTRYGNFDGIKKIGGTVDIIK